MAKVKDVSEFAESVREEAAAILRREWPFSLAIATLRVLVEHGPCAHDIIARETGRTKGNRLRPLRYLGFVDAHDSHPAPVYSITPPGRAFMVPPQIGINQPATHPSPAPPFSLPEEVSDEGCVEGAARTITVNAYERDPEARRRCIAAHGTTCCVCGFSFGAVYGPIAEGYIHVHHLRPLSEAGGAHAVDPVADLRPVCPNCHAVLHRRVPAFTIEELRELLLAQSGF